ncbi:MAG: hypothetical protein HY908_04420 [Myxococcales bacterium]|nr:hypothetical protein [Myxococcales bacterium]
MRWRWVAGGIGVVAAASCALEGFRKSDPDETQGGAGNGPTCGSAEYPPPPSLSDAGGDVSFVVAVRRVLLTRQVDGGALGVDLDSRCTCQGEDSTCVVPGDGGACDFPGGRDNATAGLFGTLQTLLQQGDIGTFYSAQAEQGKWSLLMRVRNYNGDSDDDQVELAWYVADGYYPIDTQVPKWDGTDSWIVSSDSVTASDVNQPTYVDPYAYVTNHMLVASLPASALVLAGTLSRIRFALTGGGVLARIVPSGTSFALREGIVAARIAESDLFAAVSSYRDDNGLPLCTDGLFYATAKSIVCNGRDILSGLGGPSMPCDALSLAVGFESDPAELGPVLPTAPPATLCPPGTDPATDTCGP